MTIDDRAAGAAERRDRRHARRLASARLRLQLLAQRLEQARQYGEPTLTIHAIERDHAAQARRVDRLEHTPHPDPEPREDPTP